MAITTQDGLIAGLAAAQRLQINKANVAATAGRMTTLWSAAGQPGAGSTTLGQSAAGVVPVDSDTGCLLFTNPPGGSKSNLGGVRGISAASGLIVIYDRLWVWGSGGSGWVVTTTTAQNTASPASLTRPDSLGKNCEAWFTVLATMGAGAATPTLSYTNSAGTAGRTTTSITLPSAAAIGSMFNLPLQAGDDGVRSIQSLTLGVSMTSGTACIEIMRRLAEVPCTANQGFLYDAYDLGLSEVSNDAALAVAFVPNSTTTGPTMMSVSLPQG